MKKILWLGVVCFLISVAGCGPSQLAVRERPDTPVYAMPPAPGPGFVWVTGEWVYRRNSYVYRRGHWARQRYGRMYYIPGKWVNRGRGWVWTSGHWR